ncbi:MAG: SLOG family protein [Sedimentibacter saalensis]|uniref:SLOG family protein n=1 Tax=Sedimentibacter saalensis TaxID=130788 RepID=UPI002B2045A2|nr:SLOG family protein [Sedimentibacter saalensis]MEA5094038.1 SLOG family protein [Sedimentibacter saalensis]
MNNQKNVLCFSGHRSERLPQNIEDYKDMIEKLNEEINKALKYGADTFFFGACYGFDLLCAQIVLHNKKIVDIKNPKTIKLIAVVPYEEQAKYWSEADREIYYRTLAECDDVITLNTRYKKRCYYERSRYMVDRSSKMICYYDGRKGVMEYTYTYAEKNKLQITNICKKDAL